VDASSVGKKLVQQLGGSRKQATAQAKAAILRSDIQQKLEKIGGFVWHVEMWPNWLQISVDALGNDERDHRLGEQIADRWAEQHEAELKQMFGDLLSEKFGELAILARHMGPENPYGSCCRTGCGGCLNGAHDKLIPKIQDHSTTPRDRVG